MTFSHRRICLEQFLNQFRAFSAIQNLKYFCNQWRILITLFMFCLHIDILKAEDVGLSPSLPYFRIMRSGRPVITYLHLYECEKFSVQFLFLFLFLQLGWFMIDASLLLVKRAIEFFHLISYCRLEYSACRHLVYYRFIIIQEWLFSVKFYLGPCISNHLTGQKTYLAALLL